MTREIKFRIWDKKHNRWFHGSTDPKSIALQTDAINLFGEVIVFGEILHDQHEDDVWKNDPDINSSLDVMNYLEVCQYTGLKDKNGKEIYEGDICRLVFYTKKKGAKQWRKKSEEVDKIEFEDGYFKFSDTDQYGIGTELPFSEFYEGITKDESYKYEADVIGNIYENPELLEEAS